MANTTGKKFGGRQKGTPNKRNSEIADKLKALGCDPLEGMVQVAKMAMEDRDLVVAGRMYSELAQYVAPKKRAVDMDFGKSEGIKEIQIVYE